MTLEEILNIDKFDSEYQKCIVNIYFTSSWIFTGRNRIMKECGLTVQQCNLLSILYKCHPHPTTVNFLISRMMDKNSNASRIIDKLVSKGLAARVQSKSDRRAVDVLITNKGIDKMKNEVQPIIDEFYNKFQKSVKESDVKQLNVLLDFVRNMEFYR
jgi:DNA-binding MarR family transcriptional regulator